MEIELKPSFELNLQELLQLNCSAKINQYLTGLNPSTDKENLYYQELNNKKSWEENSKKSFVIIYEKNPVGRITFIHDESSTNISYWLIPEYRNKGIMSNALNIAFHNVFRNDNIRFCFASCVKNNFDSKKILQKFGFSKINSNKENFDNYVLTKKKFFDF